MAKTENQKRIAAAPQPVDLAPPDSVPPEGLDKVRDILFGGQMRTVETRLQNLEERLLREQDAMRAEFGRQLTDIEAEAKRELKALADQLTAERVKRGEELKVLAADLKDALRNLEKRHVKLEEMAGTADAELRDSILEHVAATAAEIERLSQRVSADLNREVRGLRHDKVDVAVLADVFSNMAGKLATSLGSAPESAPGSPRGGARSAARDGQRS